MDFDNGGEFLNWAVIKWAAERDIYFTRSRPYRKNDQPTIESKNNHLVRENAFYYRYDTDEERHALNRLWNRSMLDAEADHRRTRSLNRSSPTSRTAPLPSEAADNRSPHKSDTRRDSGMVTSVLRGLG